MEYKANSEKQDKKENRKTHSCDTKDLWELVIKRRCNSIF